MYRASRRRSISEPVDCWESAGTAPARPAPRAESPRSGNKRRIEQSLRSGAEFACRWSFRRSVGDWSEREAQTIRDSDAAPAGAQHAAKCEQRGRAGGGNYVVQHHVVAKPDGAGRGIAEITDGGRVGVAGEGSQ